MESFKIRCRTFVQRLLITLRLFGQNGLAGHAAAGAYGFLLSAVPALLAAAFVLLTTLRSSPHAVTELLMKVEFFRNNFGDARLIETFLSAARPGISGVISILSVLWAARIFAQAIQRGLRIVFPGAKAGDFLLSYLMMFAVEFLVLAAVILMVLSSQMAASVYGLFGSLLGGLSAFADMSGLTKLVPAAGLALLSYCTYRIVPAHAPGRLSALRGTASGIVLFILTSSLLHLFAGEMRYNFLYGALGNLIILLGDVYFFFYFYFFGAQTAFVLDSFDALLFSRFRQLRGEKPTLFNLPDRLVFSSVQGRLARYHRVFTEGETIFTRGEDSHEAYYLLSGEAEVCLEDETGSGPGAVAILKPGVFFGEMAAILPGPRSATIKVSHAASALVLPPPLFRQILASDPTMDRAVIEDLSRRLMHTNEKILEK